MKRVTLAFFYAGILLADERLSPELNDLLAQPETLRRKHGAEEPIDVIVQYREDHGSKAVRRVPGIIKQEFQSVPMRVVSIAPSRLVDLLQDPAVTYVTPDREVSASGSAVLGLEKVRAVNGLPSTLSTNVAGRAATGAGIGIAVIDSGVNGDQTFSNPGALTCSGSRLRFSQNWVTTETYLDPSLATVDSYGHGTHVGSIIASNGHCIDFSGLSTSISQPFSGMAPAAHLINLKVLDSAGKGRDSWVIAAIDRAIALRTTHNIRVINLSLGRFIRESFTLDPLCQAVERAWRAGIVVVVAAGNNGRDNSMNTQGYSTITSPGNSPWAITVGAARFESGVALVRTNATAATYSSKGPSLRDRVVKPDIVAPGNRVVARTGIYNHLRGYQSNISDDYMVGGMRMNPSFILSGTSMATPVVSGTVALMLQRANTLTPDQVKARLMKTAWKGFAPTAAVHDATTGQTFNLQHDVFTIGAGLLDIPAALANTDTIPTGARALSPRVTVVNGSVRLTTSYPSITNTSIVWGETVVWGSNVVWGSSNILSNNVVWGSTVVWGSSNMQGYSIVWGENVVWGSGDPFSESLSIAGDQ